MKKTLIIIAASISISGAGALSYYMHLKSTPVYAAGQIVDSLKTKNRAKFESYVEQDKVINSLIDDLVSNSIKDTTEKDGFVWGKIGAAIGAKLADAFKSEIKNVVKKEINAFFDGTNEFKELSDNEIAKLSDEGKQEYFKNLFEDIANPNEEKNKSILSKHYFKDIIFSGEFSENTSDFTSFISGLFKHNFYEKTFEIKFKFEKTSERWILVKIENADELLKKLRQ